MVNLQETDEMNVDVIGEETKDLAWCVRGIAGHGVDPQ